MAMTSAAAVSEPRNVKWTPGVYQFEEVDIETPEKMLAFHIIGRALIDVVDHFALDTRNGTYGEAARWVLDVSNREFGFRWLMGHVLGDAAEDAIDELQRLVYEHKRYVLEEIADKFRHYVY